MYILNYNNLFILFMAFGLGMIQSFFFFFLIVFFFINLYTTHHITVNCKTKKRGKEGNLHVAVQYNNFRVYSYLFIKQVTVITQSR